MESGGNVAGASMGELVQARDGLEGDMGRQFGQGLMIDGLSTDITVGPGEGCDDWLVVVCKFEPL